MSLGLRSRVVRRHLLVGTASAALALVIFLVLQVSTETWAGNDNWRKADGLLWRYNVATGSVALLLLTATLAIGAVRVLRGGEPTVHLPLRRVLGVWTAIAVMAHFPGGLVIHSDGWAFWRPFTRILPTDGDIADPFSIAYWAGLVALTSIAVLAVTSNDRSMRSLGGPRWKRLHRLSYVAAGAVAVHVTAMQVAEGRDLRQAALTIIVVVALMALPMTAYLSKRKRAT